MNINPSTATDTYKLDHRRQYPEGTSLVFSNLTARKSRRNFEKSVFFGLQYFIKEYLIKQWNQNFFSLPEEEVVSKFQRRINNFLGPNNIGEQHIRDLHKLGYLPISIRALPEGSQIPIKVPSLVIYNTNKDFFWLTNYLETILSSIIWGTCTSATTANAFRKILEEFALKTVGNVDFVKWQAHDFSFRGMFGLEAAAMSGAAHLISFAGTDSIPAVDFLEEYYGADSDKELIGGSVPATEHSVSSLNIVLNSKKYQDESEKDKLLKGDVDYIRRMLQLYPQGIVSVVSDTFDYWNTVSNTVKILKDEILARDGKLVCRPDTGNPVNIICGYKVADYDAKDYGDAEIAKMPTGKYCRIENGSLSEVVNLSEEEVKGSIETLWDIFGGAVSEKGYKILDPHIGLIYGDSITLERAKEICERLEKKGFASTNVVFGVGSYTYQFCTRDTEGYAVKATYAEINGEPFEIFKDPATDDGTKKSARGLTAVFKDENGEFYLKDKATWEEVENCELKEVFRDGKLLIDQPLSEIRQRLNFN